MEDINTNVLVQKELARSRYSVVSTGLCQTTQTMVVVKRLRRSRSMKEAVDAELNLLEAVQGKEGIVQVQEIIRGKKYSHVVFPLYIRGDLIDRITDKGYLPEPIAKKYFRQLIAALYTLRKAGITHRDIKPDNLLLTSDDRLHLTDFGLAVEGLKNLEGLVGTPYYMAPEVLSRVPYTASVDLWSAGVTLYTMLTGCLAFTGEAAEEVLESQCTVDLRKPARWPTPVSHAAQNLVLSMLQLRPSHRLSLDQVKQHSWLTSSSGFHPSRLS